MARMQRGVDREDRVPSACSPAPDLGVRPEKGKEREPTRRSHAQNTGERAKLTVPCKLGADRTKQPLPFKHPTPLPPYGAKA